MKKICALIYVCLLFAFTFSLFAAAPSNNYCSKGPKKDHICKKGKTDGNQWSWGCDKAEKGSICE